MSRFSKYILLCLAFLIRIAVASYWQLDHMEYNLAKCVSNLIYDEKVNYTRNIRISVSTEPGQARFIPGDIIDQIRAKGRYSLIAFELLPAATENSLYEIHTRLLIVDSYNSFTDLLQRQRASSNDIHGLRQYYYIVLTQYQEGTNVIEKILEFCLQNYIVNVNVIVEDSVGTNTIYTYFPFTEKTCRRSSTTVYNRFADGKFQWNRPVFPKKLRNLWLCPIRAITWHKPPFIFLEDRQVSGIDGNFLIFLSKAMNFTLNVIESPQGLGEVLPNGTMNGAFKIIEDGNGDLMVGGTICSNIRRNHLACTRNYFTTSVQIIVKKPDPYSSIEVLLFPFDSQTWCTLLIFLSINLIVRGLWKKIARHLSVNEIFSTRLQSISWLLSIFIIRSSYEGSIFQFLHNQPMRRVPQNFEGALAEGYKFIVKSSYLPFIKHIPDLVGQLLLSEISLGQLFDEFDKFNGKYALINLDNYLTVVANDSTRYGQYVEIREPILHNIVCVYMSRFSFLTEELNHRIEMMINHGHMQKVYDISVTDKLRKIKSAHGSGAHTIPLYEIIGAFEFLLCMIGVGFLFLIFEIMATKNSIFKKVVNCLH